MFLVERVTDKIVSVPNKLSAISLRHKGKKV